MEVPAGAEAVVSLFMEGSSAGVNRSPSMEVPVAAEGSVAILGQVLCQPQRVPWLVVWLGQMGV